MDLLGLMCDRVESAVESSVWQSQQERLDGLRETMSSSRRWAPVAGSVTDWEDEEGRWSWGVPDTAPEAPQAVLAEYGDEREPPEPLVRRGAMWASEMRYTIEDHLTEEGF